MRLPTEENATEIWMREKREAAIEQCKKYCDENNLDYNHTLRMVNELSCIIPAEQCSACFRVISDILEIHKEPQVIHISLWIPIIAIITLVGFVALFIWGVIIF